MISRLSTYRIPSWGVIAVGLLLCVTTASAGQVMGGASSTSVDADMLAANCRNAAEYSRRLGGKSMLVILRGQMLCEDYAAGAGPERSYRLASGTKSFWGVLALAAVDDGLFELDDPVSATITEWRNDPNKSRIKVRQLLDFTSGLDPATDTLQGRPGQSDKFAAVLGIRGKDAPGHSFAYGPSHLFAFGVYLQRKLAAAGKNPDPLRYLESRILEPIGLEIGSWQKDGAGNPIMPAGAHVTAREWAKFGQLIDNGGLWQGRQIISPGLMRQLSEGSQANPAYGLTFWLNRGSPSSQSADIVDANATDRHRRKSDQGFIYSAGPRDLIMAAGQGKQRLYIIPSLHLVVVRQGEGGKGWRDSEFLASLLEGTTPKAAGSRDPPAAVAASDWRSACADDMQRFCPDSGVGARALRQCFAAHRDQISQSCKEAVRSMRAARGHSDGEQPFPGD